MRNCPRLLIALAILISTSIVVPPDISAQAAQRAGHQIIVYEGHVKFCNLDGNCVDVLAGQIATIRDGHQAPDQPAQAMPSDVTEAANATTVGATLAGAPPVHHIGRPWMDYRVDGGCGDSSDRSADCHPRRWHNCETRNCVPNQS